jgi:hypothetical protein
MHVFEYTLQEMYCEEEKILPELFTFLRNIKAAPAATAIYFSDLHQSWETASQK